VGGKPDLRVPVVESGDPEVDQLELARGGDHQVGGLEISKDNRMWFLGVQISQDFSYLLTDR